MITGNEPVTPLQYLNDNTTYDSYGLTIRQHFAAMAMQGILSSLDNDTPIIGGLLAEYAVKCADALIAELNKTTPNE